MPTLNIKNPHVYALAKELAEATGESMTGAIECALQQRLDGIRDHTVRERAERRARVDELLDDMARRLGPLEGDPTAFLYSRESGLPERSWTLPNHRNDRG